jgi:hypothetical protein
MPAQLHVGHAAVILQLGQDAAVDRVDVRQIGGIAVRHKIHFVVIDFGASVL